MAERKLVRVLYMEDDVGMAPLLKRRLVQAGYSVDLAGDGEEGLATYHAGSCDVVAVDQSMLVQSGLEVIQILASEGPLPPTIMITGTGSEDIAVEAMKLGADDYVVKDVDCGYLDLVPTVIEQVLEQRSLREENEREDRELRKAHDELTLLYAQLHEAKDRLSYLLHCFVPEEVAQKLEETPQPPNPGGERREASILFADVRSSTATAEALEPGDPQRPFSGGHRGDPPAPGHVDGARGRHGDGSL